MKARRTIEDFRRDIAERRSTPGDEERKQRIKANGLECLRRLHGDQTWEDWEGVAAAMEVITEEAQDAVGTSEWDKDNKRLVREFNSRWDDYEATLGSNHKPLSKQERWAVRTIMITPEIRTWRGLLDGPQKRKLNHPNAVINKWKAATQTREARVPRQPSPALSPALAARDKKIEGFLRSRPRPSQKLSSRCATRSPLERRHSSGCSEVSNASAARKRGKSLPKTSVRQAFRYG